MLLRPAIADDTIVTTLRDHFGLTVDSIEFLPLGYDSNAGVFRVIADDTPYFLKAKRGVPNEIGVAVPKALRDLGIAQVVAPLPTLNGALWASSGDWHLILYPFVQGVNGFEQAMTDAQWVELGQALRRIHDAELPDELLSLIPREALSPRDRQRARTYDAQMDSRAATDAASARLIAYWRTHRPEIMHVVDRAEALAADLLSSMGKRKHVLCHADLHGGNVLLGPNGELHIVDWDAPILAPKERDLMFIGNGIGRGWDKADSVAAFYRGYGPVEVDQAVLAYYRYERIVADIAEFCAHILESDAGAEDREQSATYFELMFSPGDVVDIARRTM
jgi:spectinomycin phosphotransferase